MLTHLILATDDLTQEDFIFVGQGQVVVGRSSACHFRLGDPAVSRRHCLIEVAAESAWVRDLGSLNGTYVNGRRLGGRPWGDETDCWTRQTTCDLHDGDELHIGRTIRVHLLTDDSPEGDCACGLGRELCAA